MLFRINYGDSDDPNRFEFAPRKCEYSNIIVNIEAIAKAIFPATIIMMSGENLLHGSICFVGARTCWVIMGGENCVQCARFQICKSPYI